MPLQPSAISARIFVCAWAAAGAASACVLPSDQSDNVVVTIEAPTTILLRDKTMLLTARAWERSAAGELHELSGVAFEWRSLHPDLATVDQHPDGTALVTPHNEGVAGIQAVATELKEAEPGMVELRVANSLAIDSVRPSAVRYGEQVTVYGIGLDEITRASLGQADLIPDAATFLGTPQGAGQLSYWVPYPAQTDRLVALSRRGATAAAPEVTVVSAMDLYHELGLPPPRVDLDGIPARGSDTLFHNPALAAVPGEGVDVLQLHQNQPGRSFTVILTSTGPVVTAFDPVVTADKAVPDTFPTEDPFGAPHSWALGFTGHYCADQFIATGRPVSLTSPVTLVRALKEVPYRDLLLAVYGDPPGQYTVTVRDGYATADPRILADRFEENDYCTAADSNAVNPDRQVVLPFADTLTIDNPYEVDWFRFTVPPPRPPGPLPDPSDPPDSTVRDSLVTIRTAARPFGGSDSSNIGLILVPITGESPGTVSRTPSSDETITAQLSNGDYYLIVFDEGGVATRYSLCLGYGPTCELFQERGEVSQGKGSRRR
jgi:hypothetical protein